jgi:hypothetical protein
MLKIIDDRQRPEWQAAAVPSAGTKDPHDEAGKRLRKYELPVMKGELLVTEEFDASLTCHGSTPG